MPRRKPRRLVPLQAMPRKKHLCAEVPLPRNLHEQQLVEKEAALAAAVDEVAPVDEVDPGDQEVAGIVVVDAVDVKRKRAAMKSAL